VRWPDVNLVSVVYVVALPYSNSLSTQDDKLHFPSGIANQEVTHMKWNAPNPNISLSFIANTINTTTLKIDCKRGSQCSHSNI